MADNISFPPGPGVVVASDKIGDVDYQRVKLSFGDPRSATDVSATKPLPVRIPDPYRPPSNRSSTIAEGGKDQPLAPSNPDRTVFFLHNESNEDLRINELTAATGSSPSFRVRPDDTFETDARGELRIWGPTTGQVFTARDS